MQNDVNRDGRNPSGDDVDDVVGPQVDGGEVDKQQEHQRQDGERFVTGVPGQERQDDGDADMTAGEGCRGALAFRVGGFQELVEEAVGIAGDGQFVLMGGEIVADVGEHAFRDVVESCRVVIVLGSRHWQEVEDQIVDEERGEDDKRGALELLVAAEKIEECDGGYQREVAGVAHQQQFVDEVVGYGLTEEQGRLTAEDLLLPRGKDMVEIGEDAVHQVGVGIPPGEQTHV